MIVHHESYQFHYGNNDVSSELNIRFTVKKFRLHLLKNYIKFATDDKKCTTLIQIIIIKFDEAVITWLAKLII